MALHFNKIDFLFNCIFNQARLLSLIRWMGGSFRENINYKTTHLVSGYACSAKSQYAYLHEIPVVGSSWLHAAWERRNEVEFTATHSSFVSYIQIYLLVLLKYFCVQFNSILNFIFSFPNTN